MQSSNVVYLLAIQEQFLNLFICITVQRSQIVMMHRYSYLRDYKTDQNSLHFQLGCQFISHLIRSTPLKVKDGFYISLAYFLTPEI